MNWVKTTWTYSIIVFRVYISCNPGLWIQRFQKSGSKAHNTVKYIIHTSCFLLPSWKSSRCLNSILMRPEFSRSLSQSYLERTWIPYSEISIFYFDFFLEVGDWNRNDKQLELNACMLAATPIRIGVTWNAGTISSMPLIYGYWGRNGVGPMTCT